MPHGSRRTQTWVGVPEGDSRQSFAVGGSVSAPPMPESQRRSDLRSTRHGSPFGGAYAEGDTGRAMSQENVELVRRYYEAYAQGGFDRLMEYWSDDLDHRAATDGIDDPGPIRGKNAMRKHIGDWIDTFDEFWVEAGGLVGARGGTGGAGG